MKNFDTYKEILVSQGCTVSHDFKFRPKVNDVIYDGAILTIPQNITVFEQKFDNGVVTEYSLFEDEDEGRLIRVYACWFDENRSKGNVIDDVSEVGDLNKFFASNVGRKFKVHIIEDTTNPMPSGKPRHIYKFTWVKQHLCIKFSGHIKSGENSVLSCWLISVP